MSKMSRGRSRWLLATLVALAAFGESPAALPQNIIQTYPAPATSNGGAQDGTITGASSAVFQKVFGGANNSVAPTVGTPGSRKGCSIVNNGVHNMYVTESVGVGSSTLGNAWVLPAQSTFNCNFGGVVLIGEIDLSGTNGDAFTAKQF